MAVPSPHGNSSRHQQYCCMFATCGGSNSSNAAAHTRHIFCQRFRQQLDQPSAATMAQ